MLEQRGLLEAGGDEGCTLVGVFGSDVSGDGTAFVEDEAIVILRSINTIDVNKTHVAQGYAQCKGLGRMAASPRTGEPCAPLS